MAEMRALTESGASHDDPSESHLFMLLDDVNRNEEQFVIVERTADRSGQTYAQVIKNTDGSWTVERREGGPSAHFAVEVADMRDAHAALTAWAFELESEPSLNWTRLTFG